MIVTSVIAVGLLGSLGATTSDCGANSPRTSAGSAGKKPGSSVVRCDHARSCDVILRRATTRLYARRLEGHTSTTVVAHTAAEAACLLLTHSLTTHIICAASPTFVGGKLIQALQEAGRSRECLVIHIRAPRKNATWTPISYRSDGGRDCAA